MNSLTKSSTLLQPLPESWIEKLFDKMLLDYGKKFTDQWAGADPSKLIAHWSNELAGYTGGELKQGFGALSGRDWPPSLPEFKRMCRQPVEASDAYYEALEGLQARDRGEVGNWSHPAIFHAAVRLAFDLKNQAYGAMRERWERVLKSEMAKGSWPEITTPALALPAPGMTELSREDASVMLNQLGAGDALKRKTDHRAWARAIQARIDRGDKSVTMIQKNFATEAMRAGG